MTLFLTPVQDTAKEEAIQILGKKMNQKWRSPVTAFRALVGADECLGQDSFRKLLATYSIRMSEEDVGGLFLRVVVLIPLAFIFLGFAVWWNRRQ